MRLFRQFEEVLEERERCQHREATVNLALLGVAVVILVIGWLW